ncbi:MAG TPA: hypothetical protein VFZ86_15565 [Thermoleophilia bacterium]|nr:hypothetical protein [Thermoleophilia bacterium]
MVEAPPEGPGALPASGGRNGRTNGVGLAGAAIAAVVLAGALGLTWWRLFRGADLVHEAFSVVIPWRWALGDRPFVDEQNLVQTAGLLSYPFFKLYAVLGGNDVTGLVLYGRHVYLAVSVLAALAVFVLARRSLPSALAALVGAPFVTVLLFETPQLTANTLCALSLTAGAALGAVTVLGGRRRCALAAGVAFGLACVAYPTVLLLAPFVAVFLAFSVGDRSVIMLARGAPLRESEPTGRRAWSALSAWALGVAGVVIPVCALVFALAGRANLLRCWDYTIDLARRLDQLGGTAKAAEIAGGFMALVAGQWYIVAAATVSYLVFRRRPGVGRWLLLLTPPALWITATTSSLHVAGAVIVYALAAPYLYLFVPADRRPDGARLLVWVWAPALLVGAMTAYTSGDGLVHAAVGLFPGIVTSGLFLAWGLAPLTPRRAGGRPWPALAALAAVVLVTLAFQAQFQYGGVAGGERSVRMSAGPWKGIAVTPAQRARLHGFAADLARVGRSGDRLLVYPWGAAYYLYWPGEVAANTYQLTVPGPGAPLPKATVSYFRRHREAPTLVGHLLDTGGKTRAGLQAACGGLSYPPVVVAPGYALHRKPPLETTAEVLARLPRL